MAPGRCGRTGAGGGGPRGAAGRARRPGWGSSGSWRRRGARWARRPAAGAPEVGPWYPPALAALERAVEAAYNARDFAKFAEGYQLTI